MSRKLTEKEREELEELRKKCRRLEGEIGIYIDAIAHIRNGLLSRFFYIRNEKDYTYYRCRLCKTLLAVKGPTKFVGEPHSSCKHFYIYEWPVSSRCYFCVDEANDKCKLKLDYDPAECRILSRMALVEFDEYKPHYATVPAKQYTIHLRPDETD